MVRTIKTTVEMTVRMLITGTWMSSIKEQLILDLVHNNYNCLL